MERAARLLAQLKPARRILRDRDLVEAAWAAAVGKRLALRARITRMSEGRLTVAVEDILWQRNLQSLSSQILANLRDLVGSEAPRTIEFVIGAPRRLPQREPRLEPAAADEADFIVDPVLQRIYVNSRKRIRA
jgi:predicted nucleic acid-binding Zn ribbon protein